MSTYYDNLMLYKDEPPDVKLRVARMEMSPRISTIRGYATLMGKIDRQKSDKLPDDFEQWVARLMSASDDLNAILKWLIDTGT